MFIARKPIVVCDIEVSPNAYLVGFKSLEKGTVIQLSAYGESASLDKEQRRKLRGILGKYTIVTFNGEKYDMPVILKSLDGVNCKQIFEMSKLMIEGNMPGWLAMKSFNIDHFNGLTHIDLFEPPPAVMISLKMYGARLHSQKLQDLPYAYDKYLTVPEFDLWCKYNVNDLDTTIDLYNEIVKRIELRYNMSDQYKLNLMSKSDAQIAEAVIIEELRKKGISVKKVVLPKNYSVQYKAPDCVEFIGDTLKDLLINVEKEIFKVDKSGKLTLPSWLSKPIVIGKTKYKVGIGGLHSQEKKLIVKSDSKKVLRNADVASYYPSMIITFGYAPDQIKEKFFEVYSNIYTTRLKAKAEGNKTISDSLKITLNGSFGKLGSKYSKLYAPNLMLQVTLTGQLMLLMLIEQMEAKGFDVVSSNTDGIEYLCDRNRQDEAEAIIFDWELDTGMIMEHGTYDSLYARDVNNYVAVYNGYTKRKGVYVGNKHAEGPTKNNREYDVVFDAISEYLLNDTPVEKTITACDDVREFISCKNVKGGGVWRDEYLGKVVRWYYSNDGDPIVYKSNGNKVAKSDKARPIMDLPENNKIPGDLDREYYIDLAIKHLADMGVKYADN